MNAKKKPDPKKPDPKMAAKNGKAIPVKKGALKPAPKKTKWPFENQIGVKDARSSTGLFILHLRIANETMATHSAITGLSIVDPTSSIKMQNPPALQEGCAITQVSIVLDAYLKKTEVDSYQTLSRVSWRHKVRMASYP